MSAPRCPVGRRLRAINLSEQPPSSNALLAATEACLAAPLFHPPRCSDTQFLAKLEHTMLLRGTPTEQQLEPVLLGRLLEPERTHHSEYCFVGVVVAQLV